ncbi:transcriptional repressor LexA [Paucibacter sp. TC2R-5]|uniref:transcriptional repressor LexA n=1 Tax=Paucibacter sp. TC2R-5 TaxID=2893555 RepID=UPI0021E43AC1|nr:transcriptional repressor LexA [Paucibacter sp. TC2R-5]MCV2361155.1 transcriptional repressor LexA [Paucibacter sp. TC2R-5]
MDVSPKLTARQQQILDLVRSAIESTGAPPTRAEIARELGFRSANAAEEHLQALARKGVIELVGGTSRGIRLKSDTLRALNEARDARDGRKAPESESKQRSFGTQFSLPLASLAQLTLPLVGRVAAGQPILAQEHIEQSYTVEANMFARQPDFLLKVRGMSMKDIGIMDGDLLAVQKISEASNGQIVVARIGDEVTVKRFKRSRSGIELLPENPEFSPILIKSGDESFSLEGLAVGLIRNQIFL